MTRGGATRSGDRSEPPGAQAERTSLAWTRSGYGLAGTGALLLHAAPTSVPAEVGAALGLAVGGCVLAVAGRRGRAASARLEGGHGTALPARWTALLAVTAVALALVAVATVLGA